MISEDVYWSLDEMDLLPEEQKGAQKGTHDLLFIEKMILQSARNGKKNLFMAWIDYRKAYDMLPHCWIKQCLDLFGVALNVKNLLFKSIEQWRTELYSMSTPIGEVKINRGIFQGDVLSPLLFVISLILLRLLL